MRPLQRLNFVLRQDSYHDDDGGGDVNFASVDYAEGGSVATHEQFAPKPSAEARRAHPLETARGARAKRNWLITGEPREAAPEEARESRDAEIAERMVNLVRDLNHAMDDALKQGLVVEPVLSRVKGRYGVAEEASTYVLSLKLFRKLC